MTSPNKKNCVVCGDVTKKNPAMFTFPKDIERKNSWLRAVGCENLISKSIAENKNKKTHMICENHFEPGYSLIRLSRGRKMLTKSAFPTLNIQIKNTTSAASASSATTSTAGGLHTKKYLRLTKPVVHNNEKALDIGLSQLVKWNLDFKAEKSEIGLSMLAFGLNVYKRSPDIYNFIKHTANLPSVPSLLKSLLSPTTELDQRFINTLTIKANEMTLKEKICSVSIDFIPVREGLFYDITNDQIIGFHDVNGEQRPALATHAVLAVAQGIIHNWRQLLALCFVDETGYFIRTELNDWIDDLLIILKEIGFDVRALVTKQQSNIVARKMKGGYDSLQELCIVFDFHHLIKSLEVHLKTCHFIYSNRKVVTAACLKEKVNTLIKIINPKQKRAGNDTLEHQLQPYEVDFLKEMLDLFENVSLVDVDSGVDLTGNVDFIKGFQLTIKSILHLYNSLLPLGINFRPTSSLNLNVIVNFTKKIKKSSKQQVPTCQQVRRTFRKTFVSCIIRKTNSSNLEGEDMDSLLKRIHKYPNVSQLQEQPENAGSLGVGPTNYKFQTTDCQGIISVATEIYRICVNRHIDCVYMKKFLVQSKSVLNSKHSNYSGTDPVIPPDSFKEFIFLVNRHFKGYFKRSNVKNAGNGVFKSAESVIPSLVYPCPCFPFAFAAKVFIRFRIHQTIVNNNTLFNVIKAEKSVFTV